MRETAAAAAAAALPDTEKRHSLPQGPNMNPHAKDHAFERGGKRSVGVAARPRRREGTPAGWLPARYHLSSCLPGAAALLADAMSVRRYWLTLGSGASAPMRSSCGSAPGSERAQEMSSPQLRECCAQLWLKGAVTTLLTSESLSWHLQGVGLRQGERRQGAQTQSRSLREPAASGNAHPTFRTLAPTPRQAAQQATLTWCGSRPWVP